MIIVNIKGGLGNQMFQYALGRKLALAQKTELEIDATGYEHHHHRSYGLGAFKAQVCLVGLHEIGPYISHAHDV